LSIEGQAEERVLWDVLCLDNRWAELPVMFRIQLLLLLPIYVSYLLLFGTRDLIAENIATDDLASRDEILHYDEELGKLDRLIVDERDQVIIRNIDQLYETRGKERKIVGIVYGARHMRNITMHLSEKLGYSITGSEWITVFDL
jgi:pheromone shutdown protein TraB